MCELPIGIKRLGYTKYNNTDENTPFCYGCKKDNQDCCKSQNNPDYAFKNDTREREKYNLNTYISL